MKNAVIIYRSKTGFTKKYANWLAESLSCQAISYENRASIHLAEYKIVVYMGSFCAGVIGGIKWFKKEAADLSNTAKVVLAVGAMPEGTPEAPEAIASNFSEEEQKEIKAFYLPGGLAYEKMGLKDRMLMKAFSRMMKRKADKKDASREQKEMAQVIARSYDCSDRTYLEPAIAYIKLCIEGKKGVQPSK